MTIMMPISGPSGNSIPKSFAVQYHVRGRRKRQPLIAHCETVQDIIDMGQQSFPAFAERNPWICIDSKHATVFVGLDPERRFRKEAASPDLSRNLSLQEESTER
jgi:hypothetical protein